MASGLIVPRARLDAAFDINHGAFLQILLADFRELAPHNDAMPFGALLALAIFIFEGLVGGEGKIADALTAGSETRFGIFAETADQDCFIDHMFPLNIFGDEGR